MTRWLLLRLRHSAEKPFREDSESRALPETHRREDIRRGILPIQIVAHNSAQGGGARRMRSESGGRGRSIREEASLPDRSASSDSRHPPCFDAGGFSAGRSRGS